MKIVVATLLSAVGACASFAGSAVKIAHFRVDISPEVGCNICGYSPGQTSVGLHDPLNACGLLIDDGESKALMIALDLIGLDGCVIRDLRRKCAAELGIAESAAMFSCTHTHSGPESARRLNLPDSIDGKYMEKFERVLMTAVASLKDAPMRECDVMFNSAQIDENYNRRFVTSDNYASFTPHRRVLARVADGPADKELGLLVFYDAKRTDSTPGGDGPCYVIGNYAAHALASHAPGIGGIRISADFPGFYREYLKRETGAEAMFVLGAAGDLVPKNDELGMEAARRTGVNLAMATINAMIDCQRNPGRFKIPEPRIRSAVRKFTVPMRSRFVGRIQPEYRGSDEMTLEVQCLSIGDIAFAGMPGELTSELGQEIKWHSPYRKTWIANLSTGFAGYISGANAFVQGGYEPKKQPFTAKGGLTLVNETVQALFQLRKSAFPEDGDAADAYPDNLDEPLVRIPGGVKETNFRFNEEKNR